MIRDTALAAGGLVLMAMLIALAVVGVRSMTASDRTAVKSNVVVTVAGPAGSVVANVTVFANGTVVCQTSPCTLSGLDSGVHFVQVSAPGFAPTATRAVVVDGLQPVSVHFDIEPIASGSGVTSAPPSLSTATPASPEPSVEASPAPRARPSAPPVATVATLDLASSPPASVVVDGKPLGMTPKSVRVAPGNHSVLFVHPEHGRAVRSVAVSAGGRRSVSVQF